MDMDVRTKMPSIHNSEQRLSSSLPPHISVSRSPSTRTFPQNIGISTPNEVPSVHHSTALHHLNVSTRSNTRSYRHTKSTGGRSTLASQPVIVRVRSAHNPSPTERRGQDPPAPSKSDTMSPQPGLPPVSDFGINGILDAIEPDIQDTLNSLAEIMGRSGLSLANEYGSHLPPQGEIRASNRMFLEQLLPVAEASSSNEMLAGDSVVIVGEDASLVDGSTAGSAAYGLLERLRAASSNPNARAPVSLSWRDSSSIIPPENLPEPVSSPNFVSESATLGQTSQERARRSRSASWALLSRDRTSQAGAYGPPISTVPVVSEVLLDAGVNGFAASNPPLVSEAGRNYPLYSYDESTLFEDLPTNIVPTRLQSVRSQIQNLALVRDMGSLAAWLHRETPHTRQSAEDRLRVILGR